MLPDMLAAAMSMMKKRRMIDRVSLACTVIFMAASLVFSYWLQVETGENEELRQEKQVIQNCFAHAVKKESYNCPIP